METGFQGPIIIWELKLENLYKQVHEETGLTGALRKCYLYGYKEHSIKEIASIRQKAGITSFSPKKELHFNFTKDILLKMTRHKKVKNLWFFRKKASQARWNLKVDFSMIFKKSYIEVVFEFLYPDPHLTKILKPQEICVDNIWVDI